MPISARSRIAALVFAMAFPSLLTWCYFVWLAGRPSSVPQTVYAVGKLLQFGFPAVWVWLVLRERFAWPQGSRSGLMPGAAFGLFVAAATVGLARILHDSGFLDGPTEIVRQKISDLGLQSLGKYVALGVFYALGHSLLEEYYWRWFVFGQLRKYVSPTSAVTVSSVAFMAHHIILLATYFGWTSPVAYVFSLAVALGGAVWAWIYYRSGSLYGPWLSHCLVDAAIFYLGYELAWDTFVR